MTGSMCDKCIHYKGKGECDAFPDGIPNDIITEERRHDEPVPEQDNDIVFSSIPDKYLDE